MTDYIIRETTRRAQEAPSSSRKRDGVAKGLERERKKLQNLIRALEDGEPSTTVLSAIRTREEGVKRLEGQLAALQPEAASQVIVEPAKIRQELASLAGLLHESAEKARPVLKRLALQVRLFPVEPRGGRPYFRAIATCSLDALTGDVSLQKGLVAPFFVPRKDSNCEPLAGESRVAN